MNKQTSVGPTFFGHPKEILFMLHAYPSNAAVYLWIVKTKIEYKAAAAALKFIFVFHSRARY